MLFNSKGNYILSSNAFDPGELNKGSIVKYLSKPGGEKLLKMRHCFHLFIFVTNIIFLIVSLDGKHFEDRLDIVSLSSSWHCPWHRTSSQSMFSDR